MSQQIEIKNKNFTIQERAIQNLVTEFYGIILKQTDVVTVISFDDLIIVHEGDTTEIVDGKILCNLFIDAMKSFKKTAKK